MIPIRKERVKENPDHPVEVVEKENEATGHSLQEEKARGKQKAKENQKVLTEATPKELELQPLTFPP